MRVLLLLLIVVMSGCGYHFAGQSGSLPGGVERIHVGLFENHTGEPMLENRLTGDLVLQLSRHRTIQLVNSQTAADGVISGIIRSFDSSSYAYTGDDRIGQYRATMVVDVYLHRAASDELLWSGRSRWSSEYDAETDVAVQTDLKERTLDELSRRLAEAILYQMLDDF